MGVCYRETSNGDNLPLDSEAVTLYKKIGFGKKMRLSILHTQKFSTLSKTLA
jgi:hypothetical protein